MDCSFEKFNQVLHNHEPFKKMKQKLNIKENIDKIFNLPC